VGMLNKVIADVLKLICKYLSNKEVTRIALTCKKLYTFCRDTKEVWHKRATYSRNFMKSIRANHIEVLTVGEDYNHNDLWKIDKLKGIKHLKIYTKCNINDVFGDDYLLGHITMLDIRIEGCLPFGDLQEIFESNIMVSFNYMHEGHKESLKITKIGKSFQRIATYGCWTNQKVDKFVPRKGQGLRYIKDGYYLHIDDDILIANKETIEVMIRGRYMKRDNLSKELNGFVKLRELVLYSEDIDYDCISAEHVKDLTELEKITICLKDIQSDTFAKMKKLRYLNLSVGDIRNLNFDTLQKLESFALFYPDFRFEDLRAIEALKSLIIYRLYDWRNDLNSKENVAKKLAIIGKIRELYPRIKFMDCECVTWIGE
jgi:hypothetical protein